MSNVFGSCVDLHTTWTQSVDVNGNPQVTFESNVPGQDPVSLCLNPIKGATLNGEPVPVENGLLVLEDMFGNVTFSGTPNSPDWTATVTFPGQDPFDICLSPVKEAVFEYVSMDPEIHDAGPVKGEGTDGAPWQIPIGPSSTVPDELGVFHDITTADNITTRVCLSPLKSINGVTPDINGNVNVADLFSNTVDNGDGTYTTTNSDGSTVTWSGDTFATQMDNGDGTVTFTMADASTVTLCSNPVKSVIQDPDTGVTTVTYADGTSNILAGSTVEDNGDGTATMTQTDGSTKDVQCALQFAVYDSAEHVPGEIPNNTIPLPCPSIGVNKKPRESVVEVGEDIVWDVTAWNAGCVPLETIELVEGLDGVILDETTFTGPFAAGDEVTAVATYTTTEDDKNMTLCNKVTAVGTDVAGQSASWIAESAVEVVGCEPICYANFIEGLATEEPEIVGTGTAQHLSYADTNGNPFAEVSWANQTSPVDPVRLTLSSPAGVPPQLVGWNSMTINAGIPKEQAIIDFITPTCGPFSILLVDLDYTTVGGIRHTVVDNFSVAPAMIEAFPVSAGLNVAPGTGVVVANIDTSDPAQGPALAPGTVAQDGITYRLDFDVDCVSQITFDVDVSNWQTSDSELFTFAFFNRTETLQGCRNPDGTFLDANDEVISEPTDWKLSDGENCSICDC